MNTAWRSVCMALAICFVAVRSAGAGDTRLWQEGEARLVERGQARAGIGWKLVSADSSLDLHGWELKPKIQRTLSPWLDAAATYKFMRGPDSAGKWVTNHGLELDLVPRWRVGDGVQVQVTQRLGAVTAPMGGLVYRYHAIPKIEWPARWLFTQTAADASLEAVHDVRRSGWVETKLTPLRLHFTTGAGYSWSLAYLLNHKRSRPGAAWRQEHVIVFAVAFDARVMSRLAGDR